MRNLFQRQFLFPLIFAVAILLCQSGCDETSLGSQDAAKSNNKTSTEATSNEKNALASPKDSSASDDQNDQEKVDPASPTIEIGKNWTRLSPTREIWADKKAGHVMFAGHICLNDGALEMFVCPAGTKEHESVIAAACDAQEVHMALMLVKCLPGKASSWDPVYRAAYGPSIDVDLKWRDAKTKKTKTQNAKEWIRDVKTQKAMHQKWIFGGSEFWTDPDTKQQVYYGNSGELICLSNFSTATIDVGVQSSQTDGGLLFETFTENIPEIGTKVYVILKPGEYVKPEKVKEKKSEEKKPATEKDDEAASEKTDSEETDSTDQ